LKTSLEQAEVSSAGRIAASPSFCGLPENPRIGRATVKSQGRHVSKWRAQNWPQSTAPTFCQDCKDPILLVGGAGFEPATPGL